MLDGHTLTLKFSVPKTEPAQQKRKKTAVEREPTTKIIVRNLAFQATKQELRELFQYDEYCIKHC